MQLIIVISEYTRTRLIQIMACRLFYTKPLDETMTNNGQLDPQEETS